MENLSLHEKSILYTEDARASINSLRDLFDFVGKTAFKHQYNESYSENLKLLEKKVNDGEIALVANSTDKNMAFAPTKKPSDPLLKQAELVKQSFYSKLNLNDVKNFTDLNKQLSSLITSDLK